MDIDGGENSFLKFPDSSYEAFGPKTIKHDVNWNNGYETGNILVNINERGHLQLNVGYTYSALPMRSWQLTDTQTNNYFLEPDFHYTVIDLDGNPIHVTHPFAVVTCRAVAPMTKLSGWTLPLLDKGGRLVALKGRSAQDEIVKAAKEISKNGGIHPRVVDAEVGPGLESTHVLMVDKR